MSVEENRDFFFQFQIAMDLIWTPPRRQACRRDALPPSAAFRSPTVRSLRALATAFLRGCGRCLRGCPPAWPTDGAPVWRRSWRRRRSTSSRWRYAWRSCWRCRSCRPCSLPSWGCWMAVTFRTTAAGMCALRDS